MTASCSARSSLSAAPVSPATDLSLAFLDSLKRRRGRILNVASLAAFCPASFL
jgi:short-subunit dehydrogenase